MGCQRVCGPTTINIEIRGRHSATTIIRNLQPARAIRTMVWMLSVRTLSFYVLVPGRYPSSFLDCVWRRRWRCSMPPLASLRSSTALDLAHVSICPIPSPAIPLLWNSPVIFFRVFTACYQCHIIRSQRTYVRDASPVPLKYGTPPFHSRLYTRVFLSS